MLSQTRKYLTFLGTLPFVVTAAFPAAVVGDMALSSIVSIYAVAIISFVCGIHWQTASAMTALKPSSVALLITNMLTLFSVFACLFLAGQWLFLSYAVMFWALLAMDVYCLHLNIIDPVFYRIRLAATVVVVSSLLVLGMRI